MFFGDIFQHTYIQLYEKKEKYIKEMDKFRYKSGFSDNEWDVVKDKCSHIWKFISKHFLTNTKHFLTCHCISRSLVSNASTTITSWHIMAIVFDSLSRVKPVSTPRKCSKESDALVWPFLYLSLESRYNCRWRQSANKFQK